MKKRNTARRALVASLVAVLASFALTGTAFAATVHGADYHGSGSVLESGEVDVLNVDGSAGETVFLSVSRSGEKVAKNLPYTIGANAPSGDQSTWAGVATLDIAGLDLASLNGAYTIEAYSNRAGDELLYSGTLYGVYADLPDGTSTLIGTRTANAEEAKARIYPANEALYVNGRTYRLVSGPVSTDGALHFTYEEYDESTTVDGVIKYVDANGAVVASTKVPGIGYNEQKTVEVPSVVVSDAGDVYRTVYFQDTVPFKNPGRTSFTIYCTKMSDADKALAGFYVCTIQLVDENGRIIASDSVDVTGNFKYTAPSTIYKTEYVDGRSAVVTYTIATDPNIFLSATADKVANRYRTIKVPYTAAPLDSTAIDVSFNLLDGTKRVGASDRTLQTLSVTVSDDNPTAVPPEQVEVSGTTYHLAGSPEDYAYEMHSGKVPSVNAFYTPEGYTPPGPYEVAVNYVNFSTGETIESHAYTSDPNATGALQIETPETFTANGVDYVRLDGQSEPIEHSYYSGIGSYTIYYRDKNDVLTSGTVINTIRVVYVDVPGSTTTTPGATTAANATATEEGIDTATTAADLAAADTTGVNSIAATAVAADDAAQAFQLNDGRTYNVFDGAGNNGTLTNEEGVNSNTERIEDNETPLASGYDRGASSSAASVFGRLTTVALPIGAAVVAIAVIALVVVRRRAKRDSYDA